MMKSLLLFGALTAAAVGLNAQTTVFYENFETPTDDPDLPANWTWQDLTGGSAGAGQWFDMESTLAGAPTGFSGHSAVSNGNTFNNLLISPTISLPVGSSALTYKVAVLTLGNFLTANSDFSVYVLPAASTFTLSATPISTETITTGDTTFDRTIDLSSFAGQTVKLYFQHSKNVIQYLILDDVQVTSSAVLGTSDIKNNEQVGIYPNPSTDFITIKSKSEIISTEIYDATGRKVSGQSKTDKIDVRNLLPGSYILNINTKAGKTSTKFIKKD
jgi:hypothetical protein